MNILDITNIILNKFNEPFNNTKSIFDNDKQNLDFKKIILDLKDIEEKCFDKTKELNIDYNPLFSVKHIHEMSFIENINLVELILQYRQQVIRKIILISNFNIQMYKKTILYILYLQYLKDEKNKKTQNDIEIFETDKEKIKDYIQNIISNQIRFYNETLCRYIDISERLEKIKQEIV